MKQSSAVIQLREEVLADPGRRSSREAPGLLEFSRTDLVFTFEESEIEIALTVRNPRALRSPLCEGYIEAAEFGAFLPWTPLTTFEVSPIEPGDATIVRLRVPRLALGGAGKPPRIEDTRARRMLMPLEAPNDSAARPLADGERPMSYAGNISVHIGGREVERHCTDAIPIYSGCNVAGFGVGVGSDTYRFAISGLPPGWDVKLLGSRLGHKEEPIVPGEWYGGAMVQYVKMVVVDAPWRAAGERLMVHVEQQSTGKVATVEFPFACETRERPARSAYRRTR